MVWRPLGTERVFSLLLIEEAERKLTAKDNLMLGDCFVALAMTGGLLNWFLQSAG